MINDIGFMMQIDAHVGGVNDLAFATPNKQLCVITCGDDKTIKVGFPFSILFCEHKFLQLLVLIWCLAWTRCLMPLVVQNSTLLKVMKLLSILFALIIKRIYRLLYCSFDVQSAC